MGAGLQIFDPAGNVVLDTSTRLTRVLGSQIVTQDGSLAVSANAGARLFAYIVAGAAVQFSSLVPSVVVAGNVISWRLNGTGAGSGWPGYAGKPNLLVWGEY